jgi:DME family drug/metabolite transporter
MSYRTGVALVMLAGLLWSGIGLGIRLIGEATSWQILFWRSVGATPALFLVLALRTGWHPFAAIRAQGLPGLVGGVALVFAFAGGIYAYSTTSIANAAFLFAVAPLITAVLAWPMLGEPVRRATWLAIAVALAGILVMVGGGLDAGGMAGNLAALGSAAGFAVFTLALRWGRGGEQLPATVIGSTMALVIAAALAVESGAGLALPAQGAAIAVAMGVLLMGCGMFAYTSGSRTLPATELALLSMVEVLIAPIWVWLFLGESASPATLLGGAILLGGLALNALTGVRHRPPLPPL